MNRACINEGRLSGTPNQMSVPQKTLDRPITAIALGRIEACTAHGEWFDG